MSDVPGSLTDLAGLTAELQRLLEQEGVHDAVVPLLAGLYPADIWALIHALDEAQRLEVLALLEPRVAAEVIAEAGAQRSADVIAALQPQTLARLIEELAADDAVELVADMDYDRSRELLGLLAPDKADDIRQLLAYPANTAGRLMNRKVVRVQLSWSVSRTIEHLRTVDPETETFAHLYAVNAKDKLIGVVRLKHLLTAPSETLLADLVEPGMVSVRVDTDQEEVAQVVGKYDYSAIPVVDAIGRLVGVVTHDDVLDVLEEEATEDIHRLGGSMPLDAPYMSTPTRTIAGKRVGWLLMLFVTATLTGYVMRLFEQELKREIMLAMFIPLLIGTGGNAGSQTTSMVIRALATGDIALRDALAVLWHEMRAGMLLGLAMAGGAIVLSVVWGTNMRVAVIVSSTAMVLVVWATSVGSLLPLVAERVGVDPTVVSGPLMSTLVDATGLFIYFSIARLVL